MAADLRLPHVRRSGLRLAGTHVGGLNGVVLVFTTALQMKFRGISRDQAEGQLGASGVNVQSSAEERCLRQARDVL